MTCALFSGCGDGNDITNGSDNCVASGSLDKTFDILDIRSGQIIQVRSQYSTVFSDYVME